MNRTVELDARPALGDNSLAISPVLGRAWILNYMDMISDAGGLDRLTVVTDPATVTTA